MPQKHSGLLGLCPQISFPSLPRQLNQHFLRQPNGGHITGMPQVHAWVSVILPWQFLQNSAGAFIHMVAWKAAGWQAHLPPKRTSGGRGQRAFLTLLYDPDHQGIGEVFNLAWAGRFLGEKRDNLPKRSRLIHLVSHKSSDVHPCYRVLVISSKWSTLKGSKCYKYRESCLLSPTIK